MQDAKPGIDIQHGTDGVRVVLRGAWTAASMTSWRGSREVLRLLASAPADARWDLLSLHDFDHLGALVLWEHWRREWPPTVEADEDQRTLLDRVAAHSLNLPPVVHRTWRQRVDSFGLQVIAATAAMAAMLAVTVGRFDWIALQAQPLLRIALTLGVIAAAGGVFVAVLVMSGIRPRQLLRRSAD